MSKKRAIIVHCWEGTPDYCWYPWLKQTLIQHGFAVLVPAMPETMEPKYSEWLAKLQEISGKVSGSDYFIGHSLGCIAILRLLEHLQSDQVAGGVVFVAGYGKDLIYDGYQAELKSFYQDPIDWQKIKSHAKNFVAIHSTNDPWVPRELNKFMADNLAAEWIQLENRGHFSGGDHATTMPEALDAVLRLSHSA